MIASSTPSTAISSSNWAWEVYQIETGDDQNELSAYGQTCRDGQNEFLRPPDPALWLWPLFFPLPYVSCFGFFAKVFWPLFLWCIVTRYLWSRVNYRLVYLYLLPSNKEAKFLSYFFFSASPSRIPYSCIFFRSSLFLYRFYLYSLCPAHNQWPLWLGLVLHPSSSVASATKPATESMSFPSVQFCFAPVFLLLFFSFSHVLSHQVRASLVHSLHTALFTDFFFLFSLSRFSYIWR